MSVVDTVEILKGRELTEDEYLKAAILGWCVELVSGLAALFQLRSTIPLQSRKWDVLYTDVQLQAYFLVAGM
jgi:hypothetical protein